MRRLAAFVALILAFSFPAMARDVVPQPDELAGVPIVLLVDLSSGQTLIERNADRRFMPASITKVMTAFTAFEMIEDGHLRESQRIGIRPETFRKWRRKGSTMFISQDANVSVAQLLRGITTVSANDGSVVLAEGAANSVDGWVSRMNANARRIGMRNSHFATPNGWPDEGRTFVTARDLVTLGSAMIQRHPQLYHRYFGHRQMTYNGITQDNHNPLLGEVEGADGIKTGFTNQAGYGFLGTAERNGRRLMLVVAGADRASIRNRAARALMEWGFAAFEARPLNNGKLEVARARVQNGSSRDVGLLTSMPLSAAFPAGSNPEIVLAVHYDGPLRAPVLAGTKVAELEIMVEGMPTSRIPLFAKENIVRAGLLRRIWNGIAGWFT